MIGKTRFISHPGDAFFFFQKFLGLPDPALDLKLMRGQTESFPETADHIVWTDAGVLSHLLNQIEVFRLRQKSGAEGGA